MSTLLIVQGLFITQFILANEEPLLEGALRVEIEERTKVEILKREFVKAQDLNNKFRQEIENRTNDARRRASELIVKQDRLKWQINRIHLENENLHAQQNEVTQELASTEERARLEEVEAIKIKTELETVTKKLTDKIQELEDHKLKTQEQVEKSRIDVAKWNDQILISQTEILKAELTRNKYDKLLSETKFRTFEVQNKLLKTQKDQEVVLNEIQQLATEISESKQKQDEILKQILLVEAENQKYQKEIQNAQIDYNLENKKLLENVQRLSQAKIANEQEKYKYDFEISKITNAIGIARQNSENGHLELAQVQVNSIDSQIAKVQVRQEVNTKAKPSETNLPKNKTSEPEKIYADNNWTLKKVCNLYESANPKSSIIMKFQEKMNVKATRGPAGFVKVISENGSEGYIRDSCGDFK